MRTETETTPKKAELKLVYRVAQLGNSDTNLDVELYIGLKRELTKTDQRNISEAMSDLQNAINGESYRVSPKTIEKVAEDRENLLKLFGKQAIYVKEIPNGYDPKSPYFKNFPWFSIATKKGPITIGWRKKVIEIDWSESEIKDRAMDLFPNEDVTKEDHYIHAWGYDKAAEYLMVLLGDPAA